MFIDMSGGYIVLEVPNLLFILHSITFLLTNNAKFYFTRSILRYIRNPFCQKIVLIIFSITTCTYAQQHARTPTLFLL